MDVAVVVATHHRPLRLRWLLEALAEQTVAFRLVVVGAADDAPTAALLAEHRLAPQTIAAPAGEGPAGKRNRGWRAVPCELVVFTDDDCRPPPTWLARLVAAARAHPGAIVQGATTPDPDELAVLHHAPFARTQQITPPHVMAQTCNIAYPRALLEAVGGFDESYPPAVGEDTDLALRARATGAPLVAAPDAVTHHAVEWGLRRRLRGTWRWQHMALLVRRHPSLRRELPLGGLFWKAEHARWLLLAAGVLTRRPWLALPWLIATPRVYGSRPRGLARTVAELPGRCLLDGVETAAAVRGSIRHRTLLL